MVVEGAVRPEGEPDRAGQHLEAFVLAQVEMPGNEATGIETDLTPQRPPLGIGCGLEEGQVLAVRRDAPTACERTPKRSRAPASLLSPLLISIADGEADLVVGRHRLTVGRPCPQIAGTSESPRVVVRHVNAETFV